MRKNSAVIVAALLVLTGLVSQVRATTNLFVVSLSGYISGVSSCQRINATSLVTSTNLVLISLDSAAGTVQLLQGSGSVTNPLIAQTLLVSTRSIVTTNGEFIASLVPPNGAPTIALPSGLVFGGNLFLTGSLFTNRQGVQTLSADLSGIWNDPINGNTNAAPAVLDASVTSSQRPKMWRWHR